MIFTADLVKTQRFYKAYLGSRKKSLSKATLIQRKKRFWPLTNQGSKRITIKKNKNKNILITINFWSTVTWFWPQELRYLIIWLQGSHVVAEKAIILQNIIIALKRALKILNSQPWRCCPFCFRPMQFSTSRSFHLMLDAVRKTDSVGALTFNIDNFVEWSRK